jgi:hypothetical protein
MLRQLKLWQKGLTRQATSGLAADGRDELDPFCRLVCCPPPTSSHSCARVLSSTLSSQGVRKITTILDPFLHCLSDGDRVHLRYSLARRRILGVGLRDGDANNERGRRMGNSNEQSCLRSVQVCIYYSLLIDILPTSLPTPDLCCTQIARFECYTDVHLPCLVSQYILVCTPSFVGYPNSTSPPSHSSTIILISSRLACFPCLRCHPHLSGRGHLYLVVRLPLHHSIDPPSYRWLTISL